MESRVPAGFHLPGQRAFDDAPGGGHVEAQLVRDVLEGPGVSAAYQPIVEVATHQVIGYEALVRGRHPELGEVPPVVLVEAATRHQMLDEMTIQVAEQALLTMASAASIVGRPLRLSVNIEIEQLRRDCHVVEWVLARAPLSGVELWLEITERGADEWTAEHESTAQALEAVDIRLGLDDYGAGAARLGFLHHRDWGLVKMDRTFLLYDTPRDRIILEHFAAMLHDLAIDRVAEGIETAAHYRRAEELGVEYAQGFWLGRPTYADVLLSQLRRDGLSLE